MIIINPYRFTATGGGGGTTTTLTFTIKSGTFNESPAGVWGTGLGYARADQTIPANTNGRFVVDYLATNHRDCAIGFDTSSTNNTFDNWPIGAYISSSHSRYMRIVSGSGTNTGIESAINDKFCLNRVNAETGTSIITLEYSTNAGASWTVIYTFPSTTAATLYLKADLEANPGYISNPKLIT